MRTLIISMNFGTDGDCDFTNDYEYLESSWENNSRTKKRVNLSKDRKNDKIDKNIEKHFYLLVKQPKF